MLVALFAVALSACNGNSKSTDTAMSDSLDADSTEILNVDSIARADSIAHADSLAKVETAKKAEAVAPAADPEIDKEINEFAELVDGVEDAISHAGGAGLLMAVSEMEASLESKVSRMTPEQRKRFNRLKAKLYSDN